MSFTFKPATRESAKLLLGLCGPSGSGKTLSALRLATGLGGTIAYIDTEQGRALQYADDYQFLHGVLPPPFSPDHYREAIDAALAMKPNVVIVDSVSHLWEGPGGILETVDNAKQNGGNDFAVWAKPKQSHQKFVNRLLQLPCHVILCFRAKEKRGMVKNERGRTEIVNLGWHPICEQSLVFELTVNVLLSSEKKGVPIIDGFDFGKLPFNLASVLPTDKQISEDTGRRFAEWCKSGAVASTPIVTADMADTARQGKKPVAIPLFNADNSEVASFPSFGEWLASLEMQAKHDARLINANAEVLNLIAANPKAPQELRDRAEALRAVAPVDEAA